MTKMMLEIENTLSLTFNLFLRTLLQKTRFRLFLRIKKIKFLNEENENHQTQKNLR